MRVVAISIAVLSVLAGAFAQGTGRLTGRITDTAGGVLPGITLVFAGPGLSEPRRVVTDADGRFDVALPAGRFAVTCEAPGFVEWRREGVEVVTGEAATLNVRMRRIAETAPPPLPRVDVPGTVGASPSPPPPPLASPPEPAPAPTPAPAHQLLEQIDNYLRQLDAGSIAFNAPERMIAGQTTDIRLLLSPQLSQEALKEQLQGLPGTLQGATVRIAPQMEATLSGQHFAITAITPSVQSVSRDEPTEWRWQVTANSAGQHRLHLVLNATVEGASRTLRTFDRTIDVDVTFGQQVSGFVSGNWQWLWTTALVPLAGWMWKRRRTAPAAPDHSELGR